MSSHNPAPDSTAAIPTPAVPGYTVEDAGHGHGTTHHKIHGWTGWGVILGLPFAVWGALSAIGDGPDGVLAWLSSPLGAVGMILFLLAAIWYCKLELDEVIMDYFGGNVRRFGLLANRVLALILWLFSAVGLGLLAFV